ncbi:hypothetical protein AB0D74_47880 [Streptomyces sp. NPDC048278]|uniref:hypothetical protein n=1 Tax=Streptomyces sp. NPDC048278 TaxID=3155809 RepID=UPI00342F681D
MVAALGLLSVPGDAGAATAAAPTDGAATQALLPTGDIVVVQPNGSTGHSDLTMIPADRSGPTAGFQTALVGGEQYVFPNEVQPLIGSLVDPSLFDVTELARDTTPVTVVAATTSGDATVPGLTVTERTSDTVTGHIASSAGASAFRTALLTAAGEVRDGQTPTAFSGVSKLKAADTSVVISPKYQQVTLKIRVTGSDGQPDPAGYVALTNMDDSRRYSRIVAYQDGEARVSVPLGNYTAFAAITEFPTDTSVVDLALPVADFEVTENLQTLAVDARDATLEPTAQTPRPAQADRYGFEYDRFPAAGDSDPLVVSNYVDATRTTILYAPTENVEQGELDWVARFHSVATPARGKPYSYDLSFLSTGKVPSTGVSKAARGDLARVDAGYYNDADHTTGTSRIPHYSFTGNGLGYFAYFQSPTRRTEYVNGGTDVRWGEEVMGDRYAPGGLGDFVTAAGRRTYPVRSRTSVDWLRGPLAPGLAQNSSDDPYHLACAACRTATSMNIDLAQFNDTVPGHNGDLTYPTDGTPAVVTSLTADGVTVAGGDNQLSLDAAVSADPTDYRLTVATNRSGDGSTTSTSDVTTYDFTSSSGTGNALPDAMACSESTGQTACRTLGLLQITAPLPTDLYNRLPIGTSHFTLAVAPYLGGSDTTARTTAAVSTSVDGTTFVPARVVRTGPKTFKVTLKTPRAAAGRPVTLRVTATDAKGNSITQTTTAAYIVAAH